MIRRISSAIGVALIAAACRPAGTSPTDVVVQFYTMRDAVGVSGAPTDKQLAALRPFITDSLASQLASADSIRSADMKRAPDEKPSFVEGDLFSSLFEGSTGITPQAALDAAGLQLVPVTFSNNTQKPPVTWTDTVVVKQERGHWLVHDVRYGGAWDFANKGSLLQSLTTPP